jgi:hypothetical protein
MPSQDSGTPQRGMQVVVLGATGNVSTSVVATLAEDARVASILGVARQRPQWSAPKTEWAQADIAHDGLAGLFEGASAVIHLAWLMQPTHSPFTTWRTNAIGSRRVFRAVAEDGVPALAYPSSVGAYSPVPEDGRDATRTGPPMVGRRRVTPWRRRTWSGAWTPSNAPTRRSGWCGFARVLSSNVPRPASSTGCFWDRRCRARSGYPVLPSAPRCGWPGSYMAFSFRRTSSTHSCAHRSRTPAGPELSWDGPQYKLTAGAGRVPGRCADRCGDANATSGAHSGPEMG